MSDWFEEGFNEANKALKTNYSSITDVPEALRSKYQSIADGVRNSKLADFMKADGGSLYYISTKNTIAVAENAISKVKITGISGPGAPDALFKMNRAELSGEAKAALKQYGKASTMIKWGGRACIAILAASDIYEIYQSDNVMRTMTKKVGGWMGMTVGASTFGAWGAGAGTIVPGAGNAVGGLAGVIVGGFVGYFTGEKITETVYDWVFKKGVSAK